jgi:hypothetical protein
MSQSASLGAAPVPAVSVPVKTKRRRRWPWYALGAVVLLIVVIVVSSNNNKSTTSPATAPKPTATPAQIAPAAPNTQAPATAAPAPDSVFTGTGDNVIKLNRPAGMKIIRLSCPNCSGNTTLKTDGAESLLVNTIGPYSGQQWADITDGSTTSTLTITATSPWTITVGGLDMIRSTNQAIAGTGDDVVRLNGNTSTAAITNKGSANFVIQDIPTAGGSPDLAVNTIGGYQGTVPLPGPALVQVTSDGTWTITSQS